jgi:SWI/SNF-related matrix-associated actin-dependent regulator of chromatin subfamily A member 5
MPKEDEWVAVAPDVASASGGSDKKIKPATSAFQYFQKDMADQVKVEITAANDGKFEVGKFSKRLRELWAETDKESREKYDRLARDDMFRFNSESHKADVEAMERRERLQRERETLLLDDEGGYQRSTRGQRAKKERGSDSSDDEQEKPAAGPRQLSAKQLERKKKLQTEKENKEAIIAEQQEDIRKGKAAQAKKRLDFLLKQSNIFSHFGQVTQDQTKFGSKSSQKGGKAADGDDDDATLSRRAVNKDIDEDDELAEADEHEATYLTSQPTRLGSPELQMRPYQLEGLNWMIRLQENGVNGILADEMGLGKTLQSISILVYMLEYRNVTGPHLVIVPKSVLSNWMNELARWAPTLKPVKFHGDKATREEIVNTILCPGQRDSERTWNVVLVRMRDCTIQFFSPVKL